MVTQAGQKTAHIVLTVRTPDGHNGSVDCCGRTQDEALHVMHMWRQSHPTFHALGWEVRP